MEKEEFQKRIEDDLQEWESRMDILRAKAEKAKEDIAGPTEYDRKLEEMSRRKDEAYQKYEEFVEAGEERWQALVDGIENAVEEFKKSVDNALSELTNIEPLEIEERKKRDRKSVV